MKKFLLMLVLATTLVTHSKRSEAVIAASASPVAGGLLAGGICLVVFSETAGLVPGALFAGLGAIGGSDSAALGFYSGWILGTIAAIGGGIAMIKDENGRESFKFVEISNKKGHEFGLTNEEIENYNASIDELNSIKENVEFNENLMSSKKVSVEDVAEEFEKLAPEVESLGLNFDVLSRVITGNKLLPQHN